MQRHRRLAVLAVAVSSVAGCASDREMRQPPIYYSAPASPSYQSTPQRPVVIESTPRASAPLRSNEVYSRTPSQPRRQSSRPARLPEPAPYTASPLPPPAEEIELPSSDSSRASKADSPRPKIAPATVPTPAPVEAPASAPVPASPLPAAPVPPPVVVPSPLVDDNTDVPVLLPPITVELPPPPSTEKGETQLPPLPPPTTEPSPFAPRKVEGPEVKKEDPLANLPELTAPASGTTRRLSSPWRAVRSQEPAPATTPPAPTPSAAPPAAEPTSPTAPALTPPASDLPVLEGPRMD